MNSCSETVKLAPLAVGGDLETGPLEALREHVRGCPPCAAVMTSAEAARDAYRAALPSAESVDLWPALRVRLHAELQPVAGLEREQASAAPLASAPETLRLRLLRAAPYVGGLAAAAALVLLARPLWLDGAGDSNTNATPHTAADSNLIASETIPQAQPHGGARPLPTASPAGGVSGLASSGSSAFPFAARSGLGTEPAGDLAEVTRPAPAAGGLVRLDKPTMGEELRREALGRPRDGVMWVQGIPIGGAQSAGALPASNLSRRP